MAPVFVGTNPIARPLKQLLDRMAVIEVSFSEIQDTDVREQMHDAILHAFVLNERAYVLPREFGMFSAAGNAAVRRALATFIAAAVPLADRAPLTTPRIRLDAFQDGRVVGSNGEMYDGYFGYAVTP